MLEDPERARPAPEAPSRRAQPIPWVSGAVVVICVLFFLFDRHFEAPAPGTHGHALQIGALFGPAVAAGQWWRVLLTTFEHANLLHIGFNMWVVVTLGFALERMIGSKRMAAISLVTALGSSGFALLFNFNVPTIGASGMILGWAGALIPIVTREGRRMIWFWMIEIAVISLLPHVSWAGHLGGFLFGLLCGAVLRYAPRKLYALTPVLAAIASSVSLLAVKVHA